MKSEQEVQISPFLILNNMKTGLVFGTFDGLHEGHLAFLRQAREHCDKLVASVPKDELVEQFKSKRPLHTFDNRVSTLLKCGLVDKVFPSDSSPGNYTILQELNPDIILLGYDQSHLKNSLMDFLTEHKLSIELKELSPFKPDQFKSSLLNV